MSDPTVYPLSDETSPLAFGDLDTQFQDRVDSETQNRLRGASVEIPEMTEQVVRNILDALDDKKGLEIVALNVREIHSLIDVIVIVTGTSPRHVRSLVEGVVDHLREHLGWKPRSVEGLEEASWVLIDFSGVTVNVFSEEARSFFSLERLWSDAPLIAQSADLIRATEKSI